MFALSHDPRTHLDEKIGDCHLPSTSSGTSRGSLDISRNMATGSGARSAVSSPHLVGDELYGASAQRDAVRVNPPDTTRSSYLEEASSPEAWLESLFDLHSDAIFNYCYRRTGNWADAEDLLSTVFLAAWRQRRRVPSNHELAWLYGVAKNVIRNHHRGERRVARVIARLSREQGRQEAYIGDHSTIDGDAEQLLAGLRRLRQSDQDVFVLCAWQGLSYEEAALALGVPVGTVRSRLSRARQKLRELTEGNRT
jgi:RNA polymerase sigma factor (sigma-70 family)